MPRLRTREGGAPLAGLDLGRFDPAAGLCQHALGIAGFDLQAVDRSLGRLAVLTGAQCRALAFRRIELAVEPFEGPSRSLEFGPCLGTAAGQSLALSLPVLVFGLEQPHPVVQVVGGLLVVGELSLDPDQFFVHPFHLGLAGLQRFADVARLDVEVSAPTFEDGAGAAQFEVLVGGGAQVEVAQLGLVALVAFCLLRLTSQRSESSLEFGDDIGGPQQVLTRGVHLPLRGCFLGLESRDARGFVDDVATLFGFGVDDPPDLALGDDRVALGTRAGPHQQLRDVTQAGWDLVDEVFACAVGEQSPGDRDIPRVEVREVVIPVVLEREGDLCHAAGASRAAAGEDHIGHAGAPQMLGALFAHGPADRINDVGLAATVGPDDARDVIVHEDHLAVRERLEALNFDLLQTHGSSGSRG